MTALEDGFEDIVAKALAGLGLPRSATPRTDDDIRALAATLGLRPEALVASARATWHPKPPSPLPGLTRLTTRFGSMMVNNYLVADPRTGIAAAFDTGADASPMLALNPEIRAIFITHTHRDHIHDLSRLAAKTGATIHSPADELLPGSSPVHDRDRFDIGDLRVTALATPGHTRGGTSYLVSGLERPLAITGDALFAGSMGGAPTAWRAALDSLRNRILALPDDTVLCPGHGPMSTVAEEKKHNPFA